VPILASTQGVAAITAGATLLAALALAGITIYATNRRLSEAHAWQEEAVAAMPLGLHIEPPPNSAAAASSSRPVSGPTNISWVMRSSVASDSARVGPPRGGIIVC